MTKLEELLEWMDDAEYAPSYGELRRKVKDLITEEQQVKSVDLADVVGRSEQLKDFAKFLYDKEYLVRRSVDEAINEFNSL